MALRSFLFAWGIALGFAGPSWARDGDDQVPPIPALDDAEPPPSGAPRRPKVPEGLPRYEIDLRIDPAGRRATARRS